MPDDEISVRRPPRQLPPEVLTDEEVRALMDECGRHTPTGVRNRALITFLYRTGLRINEALGVFLKDVNMDNGTVRVIHGKGGNARTAGLDPGGFAAIQSWLDARIRLGLTGRHPIFCTVHGNPIADSYVRGMFKRLATRAGIEKRVHPHGLRHTHAAQLRAEGIEVGIISRQLGHASITTTARYLDHIEPQAVIDAIQNRTWSGV